MGDRDAGGSPASGQTEGVSTIGSTDQPLAEVAALYDRIAPSFQRWWAPVIEPAALRLLDLVGPVVTEAPTAVIVDVGAGTGPLARAAVRRWPGVRAIAVDPSTGMLDLGRAIAGKTLPPPARDRLDWLEGVAERLPVADGAVDIVVSSFVLQYLPNRVAALREARRVLRAAGAVAAVTWLDNDWSFAPWRLLSELLVELHVDRPPSPETGLFRSLPSAAALLRRAGFRDVHATEAVVEYRWALEPFLHCALESEERALVDSLDAPTRQRLERRFRQRLAELSTADLVYRDLVAYVTGRAPG